MTFPSPAGRSGHIPGEEGLWVLIFGDMIVFSVFFVSCAMSRAQDVAQFHKSQALLDQHLGLLNTLLMLTSSWCVAQAVAAVQRQDPRARLYLAGGISGGVGFVIVKAFEYSAKISHGITLTTNDFFTYYYGLTAIHLIHVLIGLAVLTFTFSRFKNGRFAAPFGLIEGVGAFWHLVDLLWIVLFALLYLL